MANISVIDGDYEQMIAYKEQAIQYNPYDQKEYVDYVSLLNQAAVAEYESGNQEQMQRYVELIRQMPARLKALEDRTSSLGWQIRDLPETTFPDDIQKYIDSLN